MALRPDREPAYEDTSFFMNVTGEAGRIVVFDTSSTGVGTALDDANALVKLPVVENGSGEYPAGMLMGDVVDKDLTRTHLNAHKRESQKGGKVAIRRSGRVTTDAVATGDTPSPGLPAYFTTGGLLSTTATNSTRVGTFLGGKDSDGYVSVSLNLL